MTSSNFLREYEQLNTNIEGLISRVGKEIVNTSGNLNLLDFENLQSPKDIYNALKMVTERISCITRYHSMLIVLKNAYEDIKSNRNSTAIIGELYRVDKAETKIRIDRKIASLLSYEKILEIEHAKCDKLYRIYVNMQFHTGKYQAESIA